MRQWLLTVASSSKVAPPRRRRLQLFQVVAAFHHAWYYYYVDEVAAAFVFVGTVGDRFKRQLGYSKLAKNGSLGKHWKGIAHPL